MCRSITKRLSPDENEEKIIATPDLFAQFRPTHTRGDTLPKREVSHLQEPLFAQTPESVWYAANQMCCSVCLPPEKWRYLGHELLVENLNADCNFCRILRKCQQRFGKDFEWMVLNTLECRTDIQICFRNDPRAGCQDTHVQLYSKGLSSMLI